MSEQRVAIVVGGGSGLGAATALALAKDGCRVVTADLTGADQVVDVTDEASVATLLAGVAEREGRLDVVVNTAGVSTLGAVTDHDAAEWRRVLDVNLTGAFLVIKHAATHLAEGGCITSLTSLNARQPGAGLAAYCASKAGLSSLTEVAALELGARGIRVNAVAPGLVVTPLTAPAMDIPGIEDDYVDNTRWVAPAHPRRWPRRLSTRPGPPGSPAPPSTSTAAPTCSAIPTCSATSAGPSADLTLVRFH